MNKKTAFYSLIFSSALFILTYYFLDMKVIGFLFSLVSFTCISSFIFSLGLKYGFPMRKEIACWVYVREDPSMFFIKYLIWPDVWDELEALRHSEEKAGRYGRY